MIKRNNRISPVFVRQVEEKLFLTFGFSTLEIRKLSLSFKLFYHFDKSLLVVVLCCDELSSYLSWQ